MDTDGSTKAKTIGKYQVQRVLGRGGMGTVYEALDPLIQRKVAIKTMIAGLAESPDLRVRFLREAQAAGGLRHRNIVTVYDLGEDKGQPYIAMEFIEGTDLEKVIQAREPRPIEWKIEVLRQICDGLSYAHRNGIVHRDIKPANIRVTPEGEVKIMDFGIAHLQSSTMTRSGLVLGTVHYMAPEQIEGHKVDHRADIFSVGAIAFELIAYRKPFDGDTMTTVMFKIMHERPNGEAIPRTEYSPELDGIVMKALARDFLARYQTLDEMQTDLEELVRERLPRARKAQTVAPQDEPAADAAAARKAELLAEVERARAEGQLQKAMRLSKRLVELDPDDPAGRAAAAHIEAAIRDSEVAQLCGLALSYAAEGETDLATRIAERIGRLAPGSPKHLELKAYLAEEALRRRAQELTAAAQEQLAEGNLDAARVAAEKALAVYPAHSVAREIRDRSAKVLAAQEAAHARAVHSVAVATPVPVPEAPVLEPVPIAIPEPAADPPAASAAAPAETPSPPLAPETLALPAVLEPPAEATADELPTGVALDVPAAALTPLPEGPPLNAEAATLLDGARRLLKERSPHKALPLLEQAASLDPGHTATRLLLERTRIDARRSEAAALTKAALDHFIQNDHARARKAVEKALALEPDNRKARELGKILGFLA